MRDLASLQARENVQFAEIQSYRFSALTQRPAGLGSGEACASALFLEYLAFLLAGALILPCFSPASINKSSVVSTYHVIYRRGWPTSAGDSPRGPSKSGGLRQPT